MIINDIVVIIYVIVHFYCCYVVVVVIVVMPGNIHTYIQDLLSGTMVRWNQQSGHLENTYSFFLLPPCYIGTPIQGKLHHNFEL